MSNELAPAQAEKDDFSPHQEGQLLFDLSFAKNMKEASEKTHSEFCALSAEQRQQTLADLGKRMNHGKGDYPVLEPLFDGKNRETGIIINNRYDRFFVDIDCPNK